MQSTPTPTLGKPVQGADAPDATPSRRPAARQYRGMHSLRSDLRLVRGDRGQDVHSGAALEGLSGTDDHRDTGSAGDVLQLIPIVALILGVIGSTYTEIATATEAAVLGVVGALMFSGLQGSLNRTSFVESLLGATRTSSMIAFILAVSTFLSLAMGFTGLPRSLAVWIGGLDLAPWMLIVTLAIFYIILGYFLDGISAIVLTMAIIEPLVRQAGFDMIWFGIFLMVVVEMAQITPPVGFNLFVLQGMTGRDMAFIAGAAAPMFLLMVVAVALLSLFPEIATFLPNVMSNR